MWCVARGVVSIDYVMVKFNLNINKLTMDIDLIRFDLFLTNSSVITVTILKLSLIINRCLRYSLNSLNNLQPSLLINIITLDNSPFGCFALRSTSRA